ncbi:hypothetical protein D3C84_723910 [compost metagenome]
MLHGEHALGGFHGVAAGVEGDALAHQGSHHGGIAIPGGVVVQLQHHGFAIAAAANLIETDPTRLLQGFALEDAMADPVRCQFGDEGCRLHRQLQRAQLLRGRIGHLAHPAPAQPARLQLLPVLFGRGRPLQLHLGLGGLQPLGEGPLLLALPVTAQGDLLDPLTTETAGRLLDVQQGGRRHQVDHHAIGTVGEQRPLAPLGGGKFTAQPDIHAVTSCNQRAIMDAQAWPAGIWRTSRRHS